MGVRKVTDGWGFVDTVCLEKTTALAQFNYTTRKDIQRLSYFLRGVLANEIKQGLL